MIEFQHSYIDPNERNKRESFYKNMLWVINGTRLKKDYPRFLKAKENFRLTTIKGHFIVDFPDQCFPASWIGSSVPVIFDFKGVEKINYANDLRYPLYILYPKPNANETLIAIVSRHSFLNSIITGALFKQEPPKQTTITQQVNIVPTARQRPSPFVFEKGRYVRRRRL